ncbi:MAG: TetR/AcrR family transcriptional regulator [Oscillospiraceae bacterium]|nr:TetR/AcrR family transcriptional regulator [Oscillospiraceae bacterium]
MSSDQRKEDQRERIEAAARALFLEKGYTETKIKDIARAAHISPSTIYLYYEDKKHLFQSLNIPEAADRRPEYEKRREEINSAALAFFGEYGFEATKMGNISETLGVAKSSLYQYCSSKEDLYFQVLESYIHGNPPTKEMLGINEGDWHSVVRNIAKTYMEVSNDPQRTAFLGAVIRDSNKFPEFGKAYYEQSFGMARDNMVAYLKPLQEAGELRADLDLNQAATAFFGALMAYMLIFRVIRGVDCDVPESGYIDQLCEIFIQGMENPKSE